MLIVHIYMLSVQRKGWKEEAVFSMQFLKAWILSLSTHYYGSLHVLGSVTWTQRGRKAEKEDNIKQEDSADKGNNRSYVRQNSCGKESAEESYSLELTGKEYWGMT